MPEELSTLSKGELITIILKQTREIEILKEQIIELKEQIKQKDDGSQEKQIPSFVKANSKRRRKAKKDYQKREHGFSRKLDTPTQTIFHTLDVCPDCGEDLGKPSVCFTRQVVDIPMQQANIAEHVVFKRWCSNCKRRVYPKVDLSSLVIGKGRLGINLMALIATMREEENSPIDQIQDHLKMVYQLQVSSGEIVEILHRLANLSQDEYVKIHQHILSSRVVYADETGGREDGQSRYHWSFSNERYQLLWYNRRRNAKVVKQALKTAKRDGFEGVLVSDFYSSYNEYLGFHQRCWVHYLRDIKGLKKLFPKDQKLRRWARQIKGLYEEAKEYPGPDPSVPIGLKETERIQKERYFQKKLQALCEPFIKTDGPPSTLCARALKFMPEMFTFVRFEGVNSDNNMAERAVRKTVIKRKISYGTRSKKGSETRSILGSLFGTWRLQNLNPFEQMRLILLNAPCQEL